MSEMTGFIKYQHIERLGTDEVDNILDGTVHIFPKIDGTNGSIWLDDDGLQAGSRNRHLTLDADNSGFLAWLCSEDQNATACSQAVQHNPEMRLYGEWLVPHTLKAYRENAWRQFYVFDVGKLEPCAACVAGQYTDTETLEKVDCFRCHGAGYAIALQPYDWYAPILEEHGVTFIPPLKTITNARADDIHLLLDKNFYLMPDGTESVPGEGVVVKNYGYRNKYGRQTWAKVVRQEFKKKAAVAMGAPEMTRSDAVEQRMVDTLSKALVDKVIANIQADEGTGWKSQYIPRLLGTVWHDFINEELWGLLKAEKQPTVDFKFMQRMIVLRIKELRPEIFA